MNEDMSNTISLLRKIVDSEEGIWVKPEYVDHLVSNGFVDIDDSNFTQTGDILAIATENGIDYINKLDGDSSQYYWPIHKNGHVLRKRRPRPNPNIDMPFSELGLNEFFFVATKDDAEYQSVKNSVINNNKKYGVISGEKLHCFSKDEPKKKVPAYTYSRKFVARKIYKFEHCGEFIAPCDGVIVIRIAIDNI